LSAFALVVLVMGNITQKEKCRQFHVSVITSTAESTRGALINGTNGSPRRIGFIGCDGVRTSTSPGRGCFTASSSLVRASSIPYQLVGVGLKQTSFPRVGVTFRAQGDDCKRVTARATLSYRAAADCKKHENLGRDRGLVSGTRWAVPGA